MLSFWFLFISVSTFSMIYFPASGREVHMVLYTVSQSLHKFIKLSPPNSYFNRQRSPAFKSVSLCFVLERHGLWLIKVRALTWIYLKRITGTDRFLMLLSKLDQRCEAAFVHIRAENGEMCRGGGERRTALFVGWHLEKQSPVFLSTPLVLPLLSLNHNLCLFFCLCQWETSCVWNTSCASACFISGLDWSINDTAAFAFAYCIVKLYFN